MLGWIYAVSLFNLQKKRDLSESLTGTEGEESLQGICLLYLWSTKGEVYSHTGGFQAFVTWRSLKFFQQRHGSHLENVCLMCDLLQSAERRLKTTVVYGGEKQELPPHLSTLSWWAHSNTVVWFIAFPRFDLLCQPMSTSLAHTSESSLHLLSQQTWLDRRSSGLQGAHLAPALALLLTFHVAAAKSHHLNIPLCRSEDMISPFAHMSHSCHQHL